MSLTKQQQQQLIKLAEDSIAYGLKHGVAIKPNPHHYEPDLRTLRASFVTLEINQQLRGCVGMLEAARPLFEDVAENAFSAAFKDRRFLPVSTKEFSELEIHISILSPSEAINFTSEANLVRQLRPNKDGLIMLEGRQRGTFLPSVWKSLPKAEDFLRHLKQKAGLPRDYWSDTLKVFRYECEIFSDSSF